MAVDWFAEGVCNELKSAKIKEVWYSYKLQWEDKDREGWMPTDFVGLEKRVLCSDCVWEFMEAEEDVMPYWYTVLTEAGVRIMFVVYDNSKPGVIQSA